MHKGNLHDGGEPLSLLNREAHRAKQRDELRDDLSQEKAVFRDRMVAVQVIHDDHIAFLEGEALPEEE